MSANERELERADYDSWKLSNNEDQMRRRTFVARTKLGKCPCCEENVYDDQLFVEEEDHTYHYSCFNLKDIEDK